MIALWLLWDQFLVPYFSIPFLIVAGLEAANLLLMQLLDIKNPRYRSILYFIPLFAPLAIYIWYPPSVTMREYYLMNSGMGVIENTVAGHVSIPSILGLFCISGLVVGAVFLCLVYIRGPELILWLLKVSEISWDDNPELLQKVSKMVSVAGICLPRLCVLDSIEPNAFTIGYGMRSYVVVTSGLLEVLNQRELEATIAHELGHIKNNDFHLSAVISTLRVVCFFNPIVHLVVSAISREREYMADAEGCRLIDEPRVLEATLLKINMSLVQVQMSYLTRFMFGVFGVSSFNQRRNIMSLHPPMCKRVSSLSELKGVDLLSRDRPKTVMALILVCSLFFSLAVPLISCSSLSSEPRRVFVRVHEEVMFYITDISGLSVMITADENKPMFYLQHNDERIQINDFLMQSLIEHFIQEYHYNNFLIGTGNIVPFAIVIDSMNSTLITVESFGLVPK